MKRKYKKSDMVFEFAPKKLTKIEEIVRILDGKPKEYEWNYITEGINEKSNYSRRKK